MPHVSRILLPLDQLAASGPLPAEGVPHMARLSLHGARPLLIIGTAVDPGGGWSWLADQDTWPTLAATFAPAVDGFGRLQVRSCVAIIGVSDTALIIDLMSHVGTRLTIGTTVDAAAWRWAGLMAPATSAMLALCVVPPAGAATHAVRPGETLSSISRTLYGTTGGWRQLYQANRHQLPDPHRLVPGTVLLVPEPHTTPAPTTAGEAIVVQPGDTLYQLAKRHLGNGNRWRTLWAALQGRVASPNRLPVGLTIPLPGSAQAKRPPAPEPPIAVRAAAPSPQPSRAPALTSPPLAPEPDPPVATASDRAVTPLPAGRPMAVVPTAAILPPFKAIERPFASRLGLSFDPVTYHEAVAPQQVTAKGTIFNAFGADAAWRPSDHLELSGFYQFNDYPLTRVQPTGDRRTEHHGRMTASFVWPLLPYLELAAGLGGQWTGYSVAAGPPADRPDDVYDRAHQRWLSQLETKVGWRPWPDRPLTLTAGLQGMPFGQGYRLGTSEPTRLWGVGWSAGARYSLDGLALEAVYRGQRLFGDGYSQSADLLQTGIAYYFR